MRIAPALIAVALVVFAALAAVFAHAQPPRLLALVASAYFIPVLGNLATAAVLLATWHYAAARRSTLVLLLSYGTVGLLMLAQVLAFPIAPAGVSMIPVSPHATTWLAVAWLAVAWHAVAAVGALLYVFFRNGRSAAGMTSRRFALRALAIAVVILAAAWIGSFGLSERLPHLVAGNSLAGLRTTGAGLALLLLDAGAGVAALRIKQPAELDRALTLTLLALALDTGLSLINPERFSVPWYGARLLFTVASWFVFVAAIRALIAARRQLSHTEAQLARVENRSNKYADRILAVWRIASAGTPPEGDRFAAILDVATRALRPGKTMFGYLTRLDDDAIVVEAVSWSGPADGAEAFEGEIVSGARFALETTTQSLVYKARRTLAWDDLNVLGRDDMVCRGFGWRSVISAPLQIGRTTYFITFASPHTMSDEPYAEDDIAYVDVVSSFFSHRFAQQQQFERIQFQLEHDALTGLLNRVQFRKAVRAEIASGAPFSIAIVDLDGFRYINDAEGYLVADELLVEVASTLRSVNETNLVARLGADEFVVLLRGTGESAVRAALVPYASVFERPFNTGDRDGTRTLMIGASLGAANFPEHGSNVEDVMRCAEAAVGSAKERGGSATVTFDRALRSGLEHTRIRTVELADAIARDQLALMYQPTFDLATRAIIGAEALVRWDHPGRGRLMPAEFVPLAERSRLIGPLSRWVLRRLIRDLSSWTGRPAQFRCYMNLAPQQLGDVEFIAEMEEALNAASHLRRHIGIEITETAVMHNVERSMQTIDLFHDWGLRIAIDDFGTGYSSLSYLKRLPIDMIKIDRSFVAGLPGDEKDAALVDMLLRMSDGFRLTTLAEGIETDAQAGWLLAHGCRYGQGYLVDRPLAFDHLIERVAACARAACV
jgi:diguanylate cyclase (GGDEF)-like protein